MIWGPVLTSTTPFSFMYSLNSELVNEGPLSVTMVSGRPWVANFCLLFSIVVSDVVVVIWHASSHFECASTAKRNILPIKGLQSQGGPWMERCFRWRLPILLANLLSTLMKAQEANAWYLHGCPDQNWKLF